MIKETIVAAIKYLGCTIIVLNPVWHSLIRTSSCETSVIVTGSTCCCFMMSTLPTSTCASSRHCGCHGYIAATAQLPFRCRPGKKAAGSFLHRSPSLPHGMTAGGNRSASISCHAVPDREDLAQSSGIKEEEDEFSVEEELVSLYSRQANTCVLHISYSYTCLCAMMLFVLLSSCNTAP